MSQTPENSINFADTLEVLESGQVWQYDIAANHRCPDVTRATFEALQTPLDFPPLSAAIVSDDRIALAVDPNVPSLVQVLRGAIDAIRQTDAARIDVVLWDEATNDTVDAIRQEVGDLVRVTRHQSTDRGCLRYMAADAAADPIYLNRQLVDADLVLPIVSGRPLDAVVSPDLTGVFPSLADSASRLRHCRRWGSRDPQMEATANACEASWLLGVQIMISVTPSTDGQVGQVTAGTPDAIRKRLTPTRRLPDQFPPAAPLVIASLDGNAQQQSWCNAARAVAAASRYAEPRGTIVLWSAIDEPPAGRLLDLADANRAPQRPLEAVEDDFPDWNESSESAPTIARVASEYRLLIHSRLDEETIEGMGLAAVQSPTELARLSRSFRSCGVLRAAQFAGTTIDTPHQLA